MPRPTASDSHVTELAFHFGAPDKLAYACRLLRKAVSSGARVAVVATDAALERLDTDLWSVSPTDFIAHCKGGDATAQRRASVVLVNDTSQVAAPFGVLVNLADSVPAQFERFDRLIEVVSTHESDRQSARDRWRHYTAQGYAIIRHDLNLKRTD